MMGKGRIWGASLAMALGLAGCVETVPQGQAPQTQGAAAQPAQLKSPTMLSPSAAARNFVEAVNRVEPVAEAICRERTRGTPCDLQIVIDDRPEMPANAYQTLDGRGQPVVAFTLALIADARNADELAFVMGHEAAHHIAGHIPRQQQTALTGAMVGGILAAMSGGDEQTVRTLQDLGATVGARTYSKDFELEADALGAEIALRAGYDPILGAAFFDRLPDPGDQFLGSHPPNAKRSAVVRETVAQLR